MQNTLFDSGFPEYIRKEYEHVISLLCKEVHSTYKEEDAYNSENEIYILSDGTKIRFPYRIYCTDDDEVYLQLSDHEKLIYDCIFSRNSDGHIREKHIRNILMTDFAKWCFPYILRLSADYVLEIVIAIYDCLKKKDNISLQEFCRNNRKIVQTNYRRMYSYWCEYYRRKYPDFDTYIGTRLFSEIISVNYNLESSEHEE